MQYAVSRGWGPFYLMERIPLEFARYRGTPQNWVHTSAYGQAGDIMIELISQPDDEPSVLRERFGRCLLYTSPSPRDLSTSRMPSSA